MPLPVEIDIGGTKTACFARKMLRCNNLSGRVNGSERGNNCLHLRRFTYFYLGNSCFFGRFSYMPAK